MNMTFIDNIINSMTNITPDKEQIEKIEKLRDNYKQLALLIFDSCLNTRESREGIKRLEESLMWCVKAIILGFNE